LKPMGKMLTALAALTCLLLAQCDKQTPPETALKSWQVFLGEYENNVNEYIGLVSPGTNIPDTARMNILLQTITNMQSMAPGIAEKLSNHDLQDFLLTYGKINTRLSGTANTQQ